MRPVYWNRRRARNLASLIRTLPAETPATAAISFGPFCDVAGSDLTLTSVFCVDAGCSPHPVRTMATKKASSRFIPSLERAFGSCHPVVT